MILLLTTALLFVTRRPPPWLPPPPPVMVKPSSVGATAAVLVNRPWMLTTEKLPSGGRMTEAKAAGSRWEKAAFQPPWSVTVRVMVTNSTYVPAATRIVSLAWAAASAALMVEKQLALPVCTHSPVAGAARAGPARPNPANSSSSAARPAAAGSGTNPIRRFITWPPRAHAERAHSQYSSEMGACLQIGRASCRERV